MILHIVVVALTGIRMADGFADGIVSQACLQCICMKESGCTNRPCNMDKGTESCGYFQIQEDYWTDCAKGESWKACAADKNCASGCVQAYMERYATYFNCTMTCEGFAREHGGGPAGCHKPSTVDYWHDVQAETGCNNVQ